MRIAASISGIRCSCGRYAPSFSISGAALTRALSAMPGIAACPDLAVTQLAAERIGLPLRGIRKHDIRVGEEEQARSVPAARDARDKVRAFGHSGDQLTLDTVIAEVFAQ